MFFEDLLHRKVPSTLRYRLNFNLKYSSTATMHARMGQEIVSDEQCSETEQNS